MTDLPDSVLREIQIRAEAYAYGQSAARNDLGCKAKRANFMWVDEQAFIAAAVEKGVLLLSDLHKLYERMLADRTHVWRFAPDSQGRLSTSRVSKPGGTP